MKYRVAVFRDGWIERWEVWSQACDGIWFLDKCFTSKTQAEAWLDAQEQEEQCT